MDRERLGWSVRWAGWSGRRAGWSEGGGGVGRLDWRIRRVKERSCGEPEGWKETKVEQ